MCGDYPPPLLLLPAACTCTYTRTGPQRLVEEAAQAHITYTTHAADSYRPVLRNLLRGIDAEMQVHACMHT